MLGRVLDAFQQQMAIVAGGSAAGQLAGDLQAVQLMVKEPAAALLGSPIAFFVGRNAGGDEELPQVAGCPLSAVLRLSLPILLQRRRVRWQQLPPANHLNCHSVLFPWAAADRCVGALFCCRCDGVLRLLSHRSRFRGQRRGGGGGAAAPPHGPAAPPALSAAVCRRRCPALGGGGCPQRQLGLSGRCDPGMHRRRCSRQRQRWPRRCQQQCWSCCCHRPRPTCADGRLGCSSSGSRSGPPPHRQLGSVGGGAAAQLAAAAAGAGPGAD